MLLSLFGSVRPPSLRKWRRLVWPLIFLELQRNGFRPDCIEAVLLLRLTQLNDKNLEIAHRIFEEGNARKLSTAVFNDSWGLGGDYSDTLMLVSVSVPDAVYLVSFCLRDY